MSAIENSVDFGGLDWRRVPADQLGAIWPQIEPIVARGLRHGQGDGTTTEHMRARLLLGDSRVWVAYHGDELLGGCIWSLRETDTGAKIWVDMLFGHELEVWLPSLMDIGKYVQEQTGARCIEGSCRIGLSRVLKRHGWKPKAVVMEF